jgi:hypothetical protein
MNDSNQNLVVVLNLPAVVGIRDDMAECLWPVSARGMTF